MEELILIAKGVVAGLVLSAPLGPVALLCARRSLIYGPSAGLVSGIGAATADMIYAAVAAFGLTVISDWLALHRQTIDLVGGGLLVALGIYLLVIQPKPTDEPSQRQLEPMDAPHAFQLHDRTSHRPEDVAQVQLHNLMARARAGVLHAAADRRAAGRTNRCGRCRV